MGTDDNTIRKSSDLPRLPHGYRWTIQPDLAGDDETIVVELQKFAGAMWQVLGHRRRHIAPQAAGSFVEAQHRAAKDLIEDYGIVAAEARSAA